MNNVFEDFIRAGEEIDELTKEGLFGLDLKEHLEKRESMDINLYLYESLRLWIDDSNQVKDKTKEFILSFFELYTESIKGGGQKAVDLLSSFWMGTKDNPELECQSAYNEFVRLNVENKEILKEIQLKEKVSLSDKKRFTSSICNTYSKGVEFIGKVLNVCIALKKIANNEVYNFMDIYELTIFKKVNLFDSITNGKYKNLTNVINRSVRNADSHLNLIYDHITNEFILRKKKKGRIVNEKISYNTMILEIFPLIGWFTQAFIYSGILVVLSRENQEKFKEAINDIYGVSVKNL
ncbi:hypothetical protein [Bacillus paramycoides]|uniref:hypothetical protein n=1 Tax=Bacillus paramycoides TaxID=2026194 RepID=UPI002E1C5B13|nr:hypothetical protein [Bacillus paramycoides]